MQAIKYGFRHRDCVRPLLLGLAGCRLPRFVVNLQEVKKASTAPAGPRWPGFGTSVECHIVLLGAIP